MGNANKIDKLNFIFLALTIEFVKFEVFLFILLCSKQIDKLTNHTNLPEK